MSITVLIVDDHEVIRTGLVSLFNNTDIKVVAQATNGSEGVKLATKHKPDVVLLDIQMPALDGFDTMELMHAKTPDCRVVMLSAYDNPTYIARAAALGASDFILKGASRQDVISTITAAAEGNSPCRAGEMQKIAGVMSKSWGDGENGFPVTKREAQVLRHIALGLSNKEIRRNLTISVETVKEHVQNILRKIVVTDRTQAAVWAVRKGLV